MWQAAVAILLLRNLVFFLLHKVTRCLRIYSCIRAILTDLLPAFVATERPADSSHVGWRGNFSQARKYLILQKIYLILFIVAILAKNYYNCKDGKYYKGGFAMKNQNCAYCMNNELVDAFGIKICDLPSSQVYLFKEQSHKGRVIVAHKNHVSELVDLTAEERNSYFADIAKVAGALHKLFQPNKINYGAYGDTGRHLHFHLVPKYEDDEFEWGGTFAMNPTREYLTEEEYAALVAKIKQALEA